MKRIIIFLLAVFISLSFSGCSYASYKDYYTNPNDYKQIWTLTGFSYGFDGVSKIFPDTIEGLNVETFFCRYDQQLPLGEGVQFVLQIKYNDDSYEREVDRIERLSYECDKFFSETDLSFSAKCLCENGVSEYVAFDDKNLSIYYIYLQCIPKDEIEFDKRLLPDDYSGYGELKPQ